LYEKKDVLTHYSLYFYGSIQKICELASTKGIVLTAAITVAIIGMSFIIWFIPQNRPENSLRLTHPSENEIIADVYSRHNSIASNIESIYDEWKKGGNVTSSQLVNIIDLDRTNIQNLRNEIADAKPAKEWQISFNDYTKALDRYIKYLDTIEARVQLANKTDKDPQLNIQRLEWQDYVNDSVNSMPIDK
jgi:hypothetical protein